MPLLNHFSLPDPHGFGRSFLIRWTCVIATHLNDQLPGDRYFALTRVHTKLKVEQAIAGFEHGPPPIFDKEGRETGECYTSFNPPAPLLVTPAVFDDDVTAYILEESGGPILSAVVALVCPSNKASNASARAFAERMSAYLHEGVGVAIIDVVNSAAAGWLPHLARSLGCADQLASRNDVEMCAIALRPRFHQSAGSIEIWSHKLMVDEKLPVLPLALRGGMFVRLDLEQTHYETEKGSGFRERRGLIPGTDGTK